MDPNAYNVPKLAKSSIPVHGEYPEKFPDKFKILSAADWDHWVKEGFVVIKNAVPKEQAKRLANYLWEYEGKNPNNPDTWYVQTVPEMEMKELVNTGMVEIYNHQLLWDNRQTPKVYEAFTDIWSTNSLWVSIDRANLNFPIKQGHSYEGFIHWDYDPDTKPQNVQGVLALSDQLDPEMGGFQCVPQLYRDYEVWKMKQPANRDKYRPDIAGYDIKKVPLTSGDLLIFNSLLPHGIRPNQSDKVRIAQYISMFPAEESNAALKAWRINSWQSRAPMNGYAFPGDPNYREEKNSVAVLSTLGRKLLGIDNW
jgi:hypothetical protein